MTTTRTRRALVVDDVPSNRETTIDCSAAAYFFARSHPEWEAKLLAHPTAGPAIRAWRDHRAIPRFASLPIVAYTAHALPGDIDRFLTNGFSAVLVKPISLQGLGDLISRLVTD